MEAGGPGNPTLGLEWAGRGGRDGVGVGGGEGGSGGTVKGEGPGQSWN